MTTDREQTQARSDASRRKNNAAFGALAGFLVAAILPILAGSEDAAVLLISAVLGGLIGAVIGWALPAAKD